MKLEIQVPQIRPSKPTDLKPLVIFNKKKNKFVEVSNLKNTRAIDTNRNLNKSPNPYQTNDFEKLNNWPRKNKVINTQRSLNSTLSNKSFKQQMGTKTIERVKLDPI